MGGQIGDEAEADEAEVWEGGCEGDGFCVYIHPYVFLDIDLVLVREEASFKIHRIVHLWASDMNMTPRVWIDTEGRHGEARIARCEARVTWEPGWMSISRITIV